MPKLSKQSSGSITDVGGVRIGHALTPNGRSGCTIIDFPHGAVAGMDQRGGGAGTRQTDSLRQYHSVQRIDAICLSGGSALGLGCSQGAMDVLREQGRGFDVRGHHIPIVPAAIIFDLFVSGGEIPGYAEGRAAALAVGESQERGNVGAGAGASIGKWFGAEGAMRGGLGMAFAKLGDVSVGVLAVVNAFGDILNGDGSLLAGARAAADNRLVDTERQILGGGEEVGAPPAANSNLLVTVTDAVLNREEVRHLASLAHNGVTISVRPAHLTFDGDVSFGAATGVSQEHAPVDRLGILATRLAADAVRDAVKSADSLPGLPAWKEWSQAYG